MSISKFNDVPDESPNLTDGTNLAREKQAIRDSQDLEALRELRKAKWFKSYYERRLKEEQESFTCDLIHDGTLDDVQAQRAVIRFIEKLLAMPENDRFTKFQNLHPGKSIQPED